MDYRFENLSYFVLICGHTNAAFMQRAHAQAHFDYCVACQADLPTLDIALVNRDGTTIAREKREIVCNWCGKAHPQPAQSALQALATCCRVPTTVVGHNNEVK